MAPVDLHGDLYVTIFRAENVRNAENMGLGMIGRGLAKVANLKVDPYVNVYLGGVKLGSTATKDNDLNPKWDETFHLNLCHKNVDELRFEVKDKNVAGAMLLGSCSIPCSQIVEKGVIQGAQDLIVQTKKGTHGHLFISVKYVPFDKTEDRISEVTGAYFDAVPGNFVRFYSCANSSPDMVPPVEITPGERFEVHSCWNDVFHAITNAQKFVFLTGWSVNPFISLIRHHDPEQNQKLGELLKEAAERGCNVRLLVWDDRSSMSIPGLAMLSKGFMNTFDEEVRKYFKDAPNVDCRLVGRSGGEGNSVFEGQTAATCFSHHQKTIMCDTESSDGSAAREVVAFVGGVDVTKGRYDTPEHPLYPPDYRFQDDFRQPSYDCQAGLKPKQPWQDIHCRIQGPGARDVVENFRERWQKQVDTPISTPVELGCVYKENAAEDAFTVQIIRSIDERSACLDSSKADRLFVKKGRNVDRSIYKAYIHLIRKSQRFVCIENQYFLGSCFMWREEQDCGCSHTVVAELVEKIINKIKAGEEYRAYVVQPLFPEGDPYSDSVNAILRFQKLTMTAMYDSINTALLEVGSDKKPTDYLQFMCLAKRVAGPEEGSVDDVKGRDTEGILSHRHRRFMIYVHSKLLIIDDEIALIGSANVNMRSLAGTRDTEIGAVLYQPSYKAQATDGCFVLPRGQVHGFRMSLWKEHMGGISQSDEDVLRDPGTLECSQLIERTAEANWNVFMNADQNADIPGHLVKYPIELNTGGGVSLTAVCDSIPDFPQSKMLGGQTNLPYVLTT